MIQRRQRNQILRLKAANGDWKVTDDGIDQEIASYFSSIFHDDGPRDMASVLAYVPHSVTEEMNTLLIGPVGDHEIKATAFQMGALKAPGSDGFPGLFFQKFWEVIQGDTCAAIKSFFSGNYVLKKLNHTNIVLVPKVPHPETLPQFRPISLCNFSVKIISKVMANRLKKILNEIVSPHQSAFVPGRQIQDNIVVAHEAFHFLKGHRRGKHSYAAIKLDLSKAYDRVQWDFLAEVMHAMGFDCLSYLIGASDKEIPYPPTFSSS